MSSFNFLVQLPGNNFECSICADVFTEPVTTPCGHNFCKSCLNHHWDQGELCRCPLCNKRFMVRPEISTNADLEEISAQIKKRKMLTSGSLAAPWEVVCDVCAGKKLKATKSCLVCLTSYCEVHLEPHHRVPSLMRHRLTDPVDDLERRVCERHQRLLELFCRDDRLCICPLCSESEHRDHRIVSVEQEGAEQRVSLPLWQHHPSFQNRNTNLLAKRILLILNLWILGPSRLQDGKHRGHDGGKDGEDDTTFSQYKNDQGL